MGEIQRTNKLILFLPAFNEAENIGNAIAGLPKHLERVDQIEILVVDDGSADKTLEIAEDRGAVVVSHLSNLGLGTAFQSAQQYALENGADILVSIDADGQFDPNFIQAMIAPVQDGQAYLVTGNRFTKGRPANMPRIKYWGNKQISKLVSLVSGQKFQDVSCGYRAYSREALYHLNLFGSFSYTHEVILTLSLRSLSIKELPISVKYFPERKSRIASSIPNYAINTGKIIFRTVLDYKPLFLFGNLAIANLLIAAGFVGFMMGHYVLTGVYTPYKSFGFIGLGFGVFGLIIFSLGLVADMLNRIRLNQDKTIYELRKNRWGP